MHYVKKLTIMYLVLSAFYNTTICAEGKTIESKSIFKINNEPEYFEKLYKESNEYSVARAWLNNALHQPNYYAGLDEIEQQAKGMRMWVLLQEINVNSDEFCAWFIGSSKYNKNRVFTMQAGYAGNNKIHNKSEDLLLQEDFLYDLIFNELHENSVDVSNYKIMDGTMYYITSFNGQDIRRVAVYEPQSGKVNSSYLKLINAIKSAVKKED